MSHEPQRSAGRKASPSNDVFKGFRRASYTRQAQSGRAYNPSERRSFGSDGRPDNRERGI